MKALLTIRLKQIYRGIIELGLMRLIFLTVLTSFFGLAIFVKTADKITAQYISLGFLGLIMLIHFKREDKQFLKSNFLNFKMLMLSEYIILSIPLVCCFLVHRQWSALGQLSALLIIINLDFKTRYSNLNTRLQKLLPDDAIEWKAGLRKQFFLIVPIWFVAIFTSFFIGSVPIAIFILGISTLSFFEKCEPFQVLLSYELNSKWLLLLKIKRQFQLFSILTIPLIALFLIFHFGKWYIPVAEYFIFCCLHIYAIMTKYAYYEPNEKSPAAQTFVAIGVVGGIIPVLLPVVWLLTAWFYNKSVSNLKLYLDDYN